MATVAAELDIVMRCGVWAALCSATPVTLLRVACAAGETACEAIVPVAVLRLACAAGEAACEAIAPEKTLIAITRRKTLIACMRIDLLGLSGVSRAAGAGLEVSLRQSDKNYIPPVKPIGRHKHHFDHPR